MEGEIIHVVFAYMNMQKIIIPSEEGQKMAQCLYLKLTHTHSQTHVDGHKLPFYSPSLYRCTLMMGGWKSCTMLNGCVAQIFANATNENVTSGFFRLETALSCQDCVPKVNHQSGQQSLAMFTP